MAFQGIFDFFPEQVSNKFKDILWQNKKRIYFQDNQGFSEALKYAGFMKKNIKSLTKRTLQSFTEITQ